MLLLEYYLLLDYVKDQWVYYFLHHLCQCLLQVLILKIKNFSSTLFSLVIFTSATIGLFAAQGRTNYSGYLSFGWWMGIVALIISVITAFSLIILSFYISPLIPIIDNKM